MATINVLKDVRIKKLEQLRILGINPYPAKCFRKNTVKEAREMMGKEVVLAGRVMGIRGHGKIFFYDLVDESGKIQLLFKSDILDKKSFSLLELVDIGDFLSVTGRVGKTQAGEITVTVSSFQIITKSIRPLPDKWHGLKDIEERYRQRYVDLIVNSSVKEIFVTRAKVIKFLRSFLDQDGFLEVETPVLQPIYGGASAKPFVTHHNALDFDMFLRISDELYLKRLIVAGFDKVYEIGKDFRNEGIDKQHNPEFTMLEFYYAYADYEKLMDYTESMISSLVREIKGTLTLRYQNLDLNFTPPWPRKTYQEVILENTGIDIEKINDEAKLLSEIKNKKIDVDLKGVVGYGAMLDALFKTHARPKLIGPMFLTDRPTAFVTLAKRLPNNPNFTASFQLLVAEKEIINAYNELNDPQDQAKRWRESEDLGKHGQEEHEAFDDDYIRALEYGMPPTAGWGMGIDRLVSILTDQHSLKDVILFPTLKPLNVVKEIKLPEIKNETRKTKENKDHSGKKYSFTRDQALDLLHKNMQNPNLRRHCYGVEAVMRALARHFKEDEELWGMVGLLHDADYDLTKNDIAKHALTAVGWLKEFDANPRIGKAILAHAWKFVEGCSQPSNNLEWSIYTCDELTGLIVAVTLVRPDKKLASVTVESVQKKWNTKTFAAGANREMIGLCEEKLGIKIADFIKIALNAMQSISSKLGL